MSVRGPHERPGGRILSVNDPVPGFNGFTVDLGAYRYRRDRHVLTRILTEQVLNLSTICYNRALRADTTAACDASPPRRILSVRGTVFGDDPSPADAFANFSAAVPYNVPPEGRWRVPGPGANLTGPRDRAFLLNGLLDPASTSIKLLAEYLPTVLDPRTNYTTSMAAADVIIANLPNQRLFGVPLELLTGWEYAVRAGIAPDERRLMTDLGGIVTADSLHSPLKDAIGSFVRDATLAKGPLTGQGDAYVIPTERQSDVGEHTSNGDVPPRASLIVIVNELLHRIQKAGVRVYFKTRVTNVERIPGTARMHVTISNAQNASEAFKKVETGTVFLNMPKTAVMALGTGSEPARSGGSPFANAMSRLFPVSLAKTYCFWDEAWWVSKLNFTSGSFRAVDEPLFEGRYHDGDVQCADPRNRSTCRGSLLVSYVGGSSVGAHDTAWLDAANPQPDGPFAAHVSSRTRYLIPGNMTAHEQLLFDRIHVALRRVHNSSFQSRGLNVSTDLPDAAGCVYANWIRMGSHRPRGGAFDPDSAQPYKLFAQLVHGLNLSLVNEAYAEKHGWAEASLLAAERALFHVHGVPRSTWLDAVTHRTLVENFNTGNSVPFNMSLS